MGCTIVAEIGLNGGQSLDKNRQLIDAAKEAGADIAKFQTFDLDKVIRKTDPAYDELKYLNLRKEDFITLSQYCESVGIEFLSTPGDLDSLKFLVEYTGIKRIKIGSDDLTNWPLLMKAGEMGLPVILSTGMGSIKEIRTALFYLGPPLDKTTLLHCVSLYPCPIELVNLRAITRMRDAFNLPVGYSDHSRTIWPCLYAATLGATIVEKHLMLDWPDLKTPIEDAIDKDVSTYPIYFKNMVSSIREMETMMGTGIKEPGPQERAMIPKLRKSPVDWLRGLEAENV